jgi:hypothetical protein
VIFKPWQDELTMLTEQGVVRQRDVFEYVLTEDWESLVYPKVERDTMMDSLKPLFRTRDEKIVAPTGELLLQLQSLERQGGVHFRMVDEKWDVFELSPAWSNQLYPDLGDRRDVLKCMRKYFQYPYDPIRRRDEEIRMREDLMWLTFAGVVDPVYGEPTDEILYRLTSEWRLQLSISS